MLFFARTWTCLLLYLGAMKQPRPASLIEYDTGLQALLINSFESIFSGY